MINRYLHPLLVTLFFLFGSAQFTKLKASHWAGSEFSYTCTATPGVYQIKLKFYADCQGVLFCPSCPTSLSSTCGVSVDIKGAGSSDFAVIPNTTYTNQSFGSTVLYVQSPVQSYDTYQLCSIGKTACNNCGTRTAGNYTPALEVFTFVGLFDANTLPSQCCYVALSVTFSQMNNQISIFNNNSVIYFDEIIINRCITPCNSSPEFTLPPDFNVCAGSFQTFNLGAVDIDRDSLSYSLGSILPAYNAAAVYAYPYSPTRPFPYLGIPNTYPPNAAPYGININNQTGTLSFTPSGFFGAPLIIDVYQWKQIAGVPVLAGISRRNNLLVSNYCGPNAMPVIKKYSENNIVMPSSATTDTICEGSSFCRTYVGSDLDLGDTTDLTWNEAPILKNNGATFTPLYNAATRKINGPRLDSFSFCWTPPVFAVSNKPYFYIVTARDRKCTIRGKTNYAAMIIVLAKPTALINVQKTNFREYSFTYTKTNGSAIDSTKTQWQIETSPGSNIFTTLTGTSISKFAFANSGTYKIKVGLSYRCGMAWYTENLLVPTYGLQILSTTNIACQGDSSGAIKVSFISPIGIPIYKLNTGGFSSTDSFSNLSTGTYRIIGLDAQNHFDTLFISLGQGTSKVDFNVSSAIEPTCYELSNGRIELNVTQGKAPFLFSLNNSSFQSSSIFLNLHAGTKTISIKDSSGCIVSKQIMLNQPSLLKFSQINVTPIKCLGDSNGSISITVTGGKAPFQYRINNGNFGSASTFANLKWGTYTLTVIDTNACQTQDQQTIPQASVMASLTLGNGISCFGISNGKAYSQVIGGKGPYTYLWNTIPVQTSNSAMNLPGGWISVTISDANQCAIKDSVYILPKTSLGSDSICLATTDTSVNKVLLSWQKTPHAGIAKYYVYSKNSGSANFILRDSIPFGSAPSYLDPLPIISTRQYMISAIDSCQQIAPPTTPHQAPFIEISGSVGSKLISLTKYSGKTGGSYSLFKSTNGAAFIFVDTFSNTYIDKLSASGSYEYFVSYQANFGCSSYSLSNKVQVVVTGIKTNEKEAHNAFTISPNPSNGKVFIQQKGNLIAQEISVYSIEGRLFRKQSNTLLNKTLEIDLSTEANGKYFIQIVAPNFNYSYPIILEK